MMSGVSGQDVRHVAKLGRFSFWKPSEGQSPMYPHHSVNCLLASLSIVFNNSYVSCRLANDSCSELFGNQDKHLAKFLAIATKLGVHGFVAVMLS